ncbi:unnamed protein product, partial [marine sediment metagenome]
LHMTLLDIRTSVTVYSLHTQITLSTPTRNPRQTSLSTSRAVESYTTLTRNQSVNQTKVETERRGDVRASSEPSTLGLLKGGRYHSGVNE